MFNNLKNAGTPDKKSILCDREALRLSQRVVKSQARQNLAAGDCQGE